jgi:hypothetical protein
MTKTDLEIACECKWTVNFDVIIDIKKNSCDLN